MISLQNRPVNREAYRVPVQKFRSAIMVDRMITSYRTYARRVRNFLLIGGVLPSSSIRPVYSYITASLVIVSCFAMSCAVSNLCLSNIKNLNVLTKGLSFVCSLIATCLRATCFILNRGLLIELGETLEELFEEKLTGDERTLPVLLSSLHTFDRPAYTYSFLIGGTLGMYFVPPLIAAIQTMRSDRKVYLLPFPAKYPWNIDGGGLLYRVHFLFQVVVTWFLYFTNSGIDSLFGFHIFQISSLLRSMAFELKCPRANENRFSILRSCLTRHRRLLRCREIFETVYGPIILWLVLTNAVVMCAVIFQGFQNTETHAGRTALTGFYLFMKLLQTFMYAWYGGIIINESENFRQALYLSDWTGERSMIMKTELMIAMLQRPMVISASRFFSVSVDMFTKILNTTVSYFFLLQTLSESG